MKMMAARPPPSTEEVRMALTRLLSPRIMSYYVLEQVNGQRKFFNPSLKNLFLPEDGTEVFIGRLPRDLFEDEIIPIFMRIGPLYEFRTMMNFSGTTRGFAFARFFDKETAQKAIKCLDNFEIRPNMHMGVVLSLNNKKLFIKGLEGNHQCMKNYLLRWLQQLTEGVVGIRLFQPLNCSSANVECALVTYSSHRAAAMARRQLIPIKNNLFGPNVEIDWAVPNMDRKIYRK